MAFFSQQDTASLAGQIISQFINFGQLLIISSKL